MQTVDYNWQMLKQEDRTLPQAQPHSMSEAEDIQIVQWHNNPNSQKISWRESMAPFTAWIEKGKDKGMWRAIENRFIEEIQYDYATNHFGQGYKIIRSTPTSDSGEAMLNVKIIEIQQHGDTKEVMLILDGTRVFVGKQGKIKTGVRWRFTNSVLLKTLL